MKSRKKWIDDIYKAQIAKRGGPVRRGIYSLPRGITPAEVMADAFARGYRPLIIGDQIVIH
jgi:hypothetical protein